MKLLSINVGQPREYHFCGRYVQSAIAKSPVDEESVEVSALGIEGDTQVDRKHHGGVHQAVYAYFDESYTYWQKELGRNDLSPGQFGENLTVAGLTEESVFIGDVYQIGDVQLQVSQPRQPCFKLGIIMEDQGFVERFLASRRLGAYFRVLRIGHIQLNMEVTKLSQGTGEMSLSEVCRLRYFDKNDLEGVARCANLPDLSPDWRSHFESRIRGTKFDRQQQLWHDSE